MAIFWIIPRETLKIVKVKQSDFIFNIILKGFVVVILEALVAWALFYFIPNIFVRWGAMALGIFVTGTLASYLLWLNDYERNKLLYLIRNNVFTK